ncbi:beta-1,4-N-acetylgalactosaminyltransferase bre-4-like [Planococcus citri]|uniref:beta-1,4-N-acetylgalactosaminyltransferase bre-4-like n=1 Tax=Planococcus citri TaxID=170843 RepID=UPI0031F9627F
MDLNLFIVRIFHRYLIVRMTCSLLQVFFFFLVIQKPRVKPLFSINKSDVAVHFEGSNEYLAQLKSEIVNKFCNTSDSFDSYCRERNISRLCPEIPPNLTGKVQLIKEATHSLESLFEECENSSLQKGGRYQPNECHARHLVAIIVPYRDRFEHLNIFLRNIHPFLQKQQLDYTIFIVEQAGDGPFNRGMLMNVGFFEAMKIRPFHCFIFHDVDLLPEDDRNLYTCSESPRHMSVEIDVFEYKLPYTDLFGGVAAMSTEHFLAVNGFSNVFWGWGAEDDDMFMRINMSGLHVSRYPSTNNIARYSMLAHVKQDENPERCEYFSTFSVI